jgi:hypothetical protein
MRLAVGVVVMAIAERLGAEIFRTQGFKAFNRSAPASSPRRYIHDQAVVERAVRALGKRLGWDEYTVGSRSGSVPEPAAVQDSYVTLIRVFVCDCT